MSRCARAAVLGSLLLCLGSSPGRGAELPDALARGDAAWALRADGNDGDGKSAPAVIGEAILAYEEAIAASPDALAPRWKLVRALHFGADFTRVPDAESAARLDRATAEAEAALDLLARRVGGRGKLDALPPDAMRGALAPSDVADATATHFWAAIAWGAWAQRHGLVGAVREGVANRIRRGALVVVALDPEYENGGGYRILARLHASLPRIPLFSGWVDRTQALPQMERALAIAPDHLGNRLLFALTLLDVAPDRRPEAVRILEDVSKAEPQPAHLVEEQSIRKSARERLAQEQDGKS